MESSAAVTQCRVALLNWQPEVYTADQVIHWFRVDRPDQLRGIPEITPALPLYAQLRRYTLAVIAAAETAAELAGVLQAPAGQGSDEEEDDTPSTSAPRAWSSTSGAGIRLPTSICSRVPRPGSSTCRPA